MMSEEDDFDLNDLDDKELVEQIQDDLYDGLDAEVTEGTEILLARGWDANDVSRSGFGWRYENCRGRL